MTITNVELLRSLLGESIPDGGTPGNTLFSEADIQDLLVRHENVVERAAAEGWDRKAAMLASLVDVQEGDSTRKMSSLATTAKGMAQHFRELPAQLTQTGTRQSRINRGGAPW